MPRASFAFIALALLGVGALMVGGASPAASPPVLAQVADTGYPLEAWPMDDAALRGRNVYETYCIGCHGETGLGDGPAADLLDPRPRNFQAGFFKFRTTPSGELPVVADIVHVINCGLQGSAMRSFPLMPLREKQDVAAYVLALADFGVVKRDVDYELDGEPFSSMDPEDFEEIRFDAMEGAHEDVWPVSIEAAPWNDEDSVERGRVLYEAQCVACHGATGVGDGSSSFSLRDWKDTEVRPRDFTSGIFRAGSTPKDLFLRLRTGLNGTPMPSVYGSDEELWDITHFIMSLQDPEALHRPHPAGCDAHAAATAAGDATGDQR
jgi:mono/diheme cytochrome c family protein